MAGPHKNFGRDPDAYKFDFLHVSVGTQRASVGPAGGHSGSIILSGGRARVGRAFGTNAIFRIGVMNTSSGTPNQVLAYSNEMTTSTLYASANQGETVTFTFPTPVVVPGNATLAFVATARGGALSVGMELTTASNLYDRSITAGTTIPLSGHTSISAQGRNSIQITGEENVAPNTPGAGVVSGGTGNRRPTITNSFSDANETLRSGASWDRLESHYHEWWWGGQLRWSGTFTATAAERNARQSQRQAPLDLPYDTPVQHYVRHTDRGGMRSASRRTDLTVTSGATVDTPTSPTGRITTPANPGDIVAVYRHNGGLNANAVRVRLVAANEAVLQTSGVLARTVTPNSSTTVTWAQSGFGTQPNGAIRGVQMQARATNNLWSPWSSPVWFNTNAEPNIPTLYQPTSGGVFGTVPATGVRATDPDQPPTDLTVTAEIYDADTEVLAHTYTLAHQSGDIFSATPPSIPHGNYKWRARANDGLLNSDWSSMWTFTYANVPSVTITAPTSPVGTTTPNISWTSTGQVKWRIQGRDTNNTLVYDTGERTGTLQNHVIGSLAGSWLNGYRWRNENAVTFTVMVQDASTLWGSSAPLVLMLEYPPIDQPVVTATAESFPGVKGTHYIEVNITPTEYPLEEFVSYTIERVYLTGENGSVVPGTTVTIANPTNSSETLHQDFEVPSGQWLRYSVYQTVTVGFDTVSSEPVTFDLVAQWHGTLIHSNADPMAAHVWLHYSAPGGQFEPTVNQIRQRNDVWGQGEDLPNAYTSRRRERTPSGEYTLIGDADKAAVDKLNDLYRIDDWQDRNKSPNGRPNGICYRGGRGSSWGVLFVTLEDIDQVPGTGRTEHGPIEVVSLQFREYRRRRLAVGGDA